MAAPFEREIKAIGKFLARLMEVPRFSLAFAVQVFLLSAPITYYRLWAGMSVYADSAFGYALLTALVIEVLFWLPTMVVLIKLGKMRPMFVIGGCIAAGVPPYLISAPLYAKYWILELAVHMSAGGLLGIVFCLVAFWKPNPPMQPTAGSGG